MSMLDTLGGLSGGLGGSGGVGGSIPQNSSAASSAATVTVDPSTAVGPIESGSFSLGPFAPSFPGVGQGSSSDINAPPLVSSIIPKGAGGVILIAVALIAAIFLIRR